MKLFAQSGFGPGEKLTTGIEKKYIDGVIFSAKDHPMEKIESQINSCLEKNSETEIYFDPQFYVLTQADAPGIRLGNIPSYKEFAAAKTIRELEREKNIAKDIKSVLTYQNSIRQLKTIIAPNILISKSFDSREGTISKNFIRNIYSVKNENNISKETLATLAISREALMDKDSTLDFVNDISLLDDPLHGFYILLASRNSETRSDINHARVIGHFLYLVHSLRINGYKVVVGYSDLLSLFLKCLGVHSGASGWFSNLQAFSLTRFEPSSGGQLAVQRYLSATLLNRITFYELDQLRNRFPWVLNKLPSDELYPPETGSEPARNQEVFQSWETLKQLIENTPGDLIAGLRSLQERIEKAKAAYKLIDIKLTPRSGPDHLDAWSEGIQIFLNLAEIKID